MREAKAFGAPVGLADTILAESLDEKVCFSLERLTAERACRAPPATTQSGRLAPTATVEVHAHLFEPAEVVGRKLAIEVGDGRSRTSLGHEPMKEPSVLAAKSAEATDVKRAEAV